VGLLETVEAARAELPQSKAHRVGCGPKPGVEATPASKRGRMRGLVLLLVHVAIALHVWHWLATGRSLGALEPSEAGLVWTEGVLNAGLVLMVLATASTLIVGRFFCGWACHVVALQDASAWLLGKLKLRPKPVRSRVLVFVPLLVAIEVFLGPAIVRLVRGESLPMPSWQLTTDDLWARFPGLWMALATFATVGFAAVWLLGSKGFCTYGCPYGAIFGVADRFAKGRIRVSDACEGCGHCTAVCTSNVAVHTEVRLHRMVVDSGCMKCMDCVSACPKGALSFSFGPAPSAAVRKKAARRTFDFSWPEEIALAALFFLGLYAYRGLYGAVPLLLAVTLAVLFAFLSVALVRLVRGRDFRLQHGMLKRGGRWTGLGLAVLPLLVLVVGVTLHSAGVQWHARGGAAALADAGQSDGAERAGHLLRAGRHLERAASLGWVSPAELERRAGSAYIGGGEPRRALALLERAAARSGADPVAQLELYRVQVALEDWAAAAQSYGRALDLEEAAGRPLDPDRAMQLAGEVVELVRRAPEAVEPTLLFARLQAAAGDVPTAVQNLEALRARHPGETRVTALLEKLRGAAR